MGLHQVQAISRKQQVSGPTTTARPVDTREAVAGRSHFSRYVSGVEVEEAIRTRRTHKAYRPEPVERGTLEELLDLARWAPNHNLTNPWRFRVIGRAALERLKEAAGPESASKLDRAPTLVVVSCVQGGDDPLQDEEDLHAAACAAYIVLLAAHGRGLAGYWRTPGVLRTPEGRAAVGLPDGERFIGLLHLGRPVQEQRTPERAPAEQVVEFLD
jgi:nitroreductase